MSYDDEARVSRREATDACNAQGWRLGANTLAQLAHRGSGPPFVMFGKYSLYRWGDVRTWCEARMRPPVSELRKLELQDA